MISELKAHASPPASRVPGRAARDLPETEIAPSCGRVALDWRELWAYRELLCFLTWRDIKVRYTQTVLGVAWAVLQPVVQMVIMSLFFGRLSGMAAKTGGVPYPIFVYAGLLPWTFFANAVTNSGNSLVGNANLISKVYFPRLVIPLAAVGAGLVDFLVSAVVLLAMMLYYGTPFTAQLLCVPLLLLGTVLAATGVGTLLAALTAAYRDFRYVVPFLVQVWMFVSPVIYPPTIVPASWRWLLAFNPMTGLIGGFRAAILGTPLDERALLISLAVAVAGFLAGAQYFRGVERRFADVI